MVRRGFLAVVGVGTVAQVVGCGDDDDGGGSAPGGANTSSGGSDSAGSASAGAPASGGAARGGEVVLAGMPTRGGASGTGDPSCGITEISLHDHTITLPYDDVTAGVERTYTLGGGHTHDLTLTAADFAQLAAGNSVTVDSAGGSHVHTVTLLCG